MNVNGTSSNVTLSLDIQSLQLTQSISSAFVSWAIVGLINSVAAAFTIVVIILWKPLRNDIQILAANLALAELIGGLSLAAAAFYHMYCISWNLPETTSKRECYFKFAVHYFSVNVSGLFHFIISIDRFMAALFPLYYNARPKIYCAYLSTIPWVVSLVMFLLGCLESSPDSPIAVCLIRSAIGDTFYSVFIYSVLAMSVAAVLFYCTTIIVLKYQLRTATAGNVSEIKSRLHSHVMKGLAINAVAHLFTFTAAAFGGVILANFSLLGTTPKPYMGVLFFTGGILCVFIYAICQKDFRTGCYFLCMKFMSSYKIFKCSGVQVSSEQSVQVPLHRQV